MYIIKCKCVKEPLYFDNFTVGQSYTANVSANSKGESIISIQTPGDEKDTHCAWAWFKEHFELAV